MKLIKHNIYILLFLMVSTFTVVGQDFVPVTYKVNTPKKAKKNKEFKINVDFQTHRDWYIYAPTGSNEPQGMIETKVTFEVPDGVDLVGDLSIPAPKPKGMYQIYDGKKIQFSQKLKATQKGKKEIKVIVLYQTCNPQMCLPPKRTEHIQKITIN